MARKTFTAGEVLTAANVNLYLSNEQKYTSSTATAHTVTADDRYYLYNFTDGGTVTVTVGTTTAFQAGERMDITWGSGVVVISAGSGVTLEGKGTAASTYTSAATYEALSLIALGSDTYRVIGNVTGA